MKIEFQDRTWELDELGITNKQAEKIRAHTGLSMQKWFESLKEKDALTWESSFDALYWLMLQQNGQAGGAISDVDYPVYRFIQAYMDAMVAEQAAEKAAEPDPTQLPADSAPSAEPSSPKGSAPTGGPPDG